MKKKKQIIKKLDAIMSALNISANEFESEMMNFEEVVKYTGLSKSYLYKLTSTKEIPHYKPSGKILRFKKKEVDLYLTQNPTVLLNK